MHKILLYVEENLLYAKDKCYHVEESKNKSTPKSCEKVNKPLISPQSVLNASLKPPPGINNPPNLLNVSNLLIGKNTFSNIYPTTNRSNLFNNQSTLPVSNLGTPILRTILQENLQMQQVLNQNIQDLFMKIKSDAAPGHLSGMSQAINVMNTVHQLNVDRKLTVDMKSSLDENLNLKQIEDRNINTSCMKFKDTNPFKTMNSSKHDNQNVSLPNSNMTNGSYSETREVLLPSLYTQNTTLAPRTLNRNTLQNNSLLNRINDTRTAITQNGISNGVSSDYKNIIDQKNEGNQSPSRSDRRIFNQHLVGSPKLRRPQQIDKENSHSSPNNPFIHTNGIHPQSNTQFQAQRTVEVDTTSTGSIVEQDQEDSVLQDNHGHRKNFIAFLMTAKTLLIYYPIPIFDDIIHVFHYKREGWLSIDEFVTVFTNFTSPTFLLNSLEILNIHLPGQSIKRAEDRTVFAMLDRTSLGASRDLDGTIVAITLIPLQCVSVVFDQLKSLDCNAKHVWNSRMLKIMTLEKAYKDIQQQIQANELK